MHSDNAATVLGVVVYCPYGTIVDKGILIGIDSLIHGRAQVLQFIF